MIVLAEGDVAPSSCWVYHFLSSVTLCPGISTAMLCGKHLNAIYLLNATGWHGSTHMEKDSGTIIPNGAIIAINPHSECQHLASPVNVASLRAQGQLMMADDCTLFPI